MLGQLFGVLGMLVAVGIVITLAYLTTIFIAQRSNRLIKNPSVKVLERTTIGLQINISIVQINSKVYIIANQGKELTVIDTVDADEWHRNHQRRMDSNISDGQQMPKSMEYLLKKINRTGLNPIRKKGEDGWD